MEFTLALKLLVRRNEVISRNKIYTFFNYLQFNTKLLLLDYIYM